jgi:hypothetical protein
MTFKVSTRLDDIYFDEVFDTDIEALDQAISWTMARLGEVVIVHNDRAFTLEEFAKMVGGDAD